MNVGGWLRSLGLGQYEALFRASEIDADILPELTDVDLEKLGVPLGHRKRLLKAISGLAVAETSAAPSASTGAKPHDAAERRQLTVMFCDLVGSTPLASRLDPEDLREIVGAYHRVVAETVARSGGFVAKYMGDGVLVYFGYPQAREDDAERAAMASLDLVAAVAALDARPGLKLACRVGIATGLVVVGDLLGTGAAQEQAVVGETPNLAARLQNLAEPDTVLVDARTHRLVGDLFEQRSLGAVAIKGFAGRQRVWEILGRGRVLSRFEALRSRATPLVGRDEEVELLRRRWRQADTGEGQVVLLAGEAGIGKSRLTAALFEELVSMPHERLRYFCSPHHTDSALSPIIAQLEHAAGFDPHELPSAKLDKLDALLSPVATPAEDRSLIAELLSLDGTDRGYPALDLTPQIRKERTLDALLRQLEALAHRQSVLMVFEDVHWIDPTSLELLDRIVERVHTLPVLLLVTFRPEFAAPWIGQPYVTALALRRLSTRDSAALAGHVSGNRALAAELLDEIVGRADGVPLFLEELTKAIVEAGPDKDKDVIAAVSAASAAIPATLQASLIARLDRLGPAKEIAQIGAIIGREFSYELLCALTAVTETRLAAALDQLVASELVSRRGVPPAASYVFKHALVQEAAHETLLRAERRRLHARIADLLEQRAGVVERQPELLAQHYAEAGLVEKAVAYWSKAGRKSVVLSAMVEAAAQLQKGLDQLALLPDSPERKRQELELRSSLGWAWVAVRGEAAPESGQNSARARELWEELDSPSEFLGIPFAQSIHHTSRGELDLALRLNDDLLRLSRQRNDFAGLVLGHFSAGRTLMLAGRFASSRLHLEEVCTLYDPNSHRALGHHIGVAPHVGSRGYLGMALLCLGFPNQALTQGYTAIDVARRLDHPLSLAAGLVISTRILALLGDTAALPKRADELVAVAAEQGFSQYRAEGMTYRGWIKVKNGYVAEGLSLLRSGSTAFRATGAVMYVPYHMALLARGCEIAGQVEEAATLLDEALQIAERTGERWFAAELNRHKGELLLRQGHAAAAEELYRKALSIAVEQEAKLWELRAAASLARLWAEAGRRDEARDLLTPVYGWFTEGVATPDLKQAKALLEEL